MNNSNLECKTFKTFDCALQALKDNTENFVSLIHPYFVDNGWKYNRNGNLKIPTKDELINLVKSLLDSVSSQKRNLFAFSSSGRITVKILKVGKQYHPTMYCDSLALESAALLQKELTEKGFHHCRTDKNGDKFYYNEENQLHREDGPAVESSNGTKEWYLNGNLHRVDGPAVESSNGNKGWYLNGNLHRTDGPAVEYVDGYKKWYLNGKLHRTDGPAIESSNGNKNWWLNGNLHRTDGPAVEFANGTKEWWLNGKEFSENEWKQKVSKLNGSARSVARS